VSEERRNEPWTVARSREKVYDGDKSTISSFTVWMAAQYIFDVDRTVPN
jgi:hypothetical protein